MWSSITTIHQPTHLGQAMSLYHYPEQAFLAGGSYLVAEHNPNITGLINIAPLLGKNMYATQHEMMLSAGVTLQEMCDQFPNSPLAKIACDSCFSKNIRNQRTLGGEIASKRLDSELFATLYALNGQITIFVQNEQITTLQDWIGNGIITQILLDATKIAKLKIFRYAIIPSANPYLILVAVPCLTGWDCVIAGKAKKIGFCQLSDKLTLADIQKLSIDLAQTCFQDDQYGSIAYKSHLLEVSFQQVLNTK